MQALYLLALDPVAETMADPNSYGFRPQRSTADAIEQCFCALGKQRSPQWILEGDIKGCFDAISHTWRSEEHTSELQSHLNLVCRLLLEKKNIAGARSLLSP